MINTCIDFSCSEISSITGYFGKKLATGLKSFGENSNNFSTAQISAREFYCTCIDHIPKLPTLIFNNESCHKYLMKQSRTLNWDRQLYQKKGRDSWVMKTPHN